MEVWILATLSAAFLWGSVSVIAKYLMEDVSELTYTATFSLIVTLFYLPIFIYYLGTKSINLTQVALIGIIVSGIANIAGFLLHSYALKMDELSVVAPFNNTDPIFVAILGFLILGESLTLSKISGIGLVTLGAFIILGTRGESWKKPFRGLIERLGPKLAILSALVLSLGALADRVVTQIIDPVLVTFFIYVIMTAGYLMISRLSPKHSMFSVVKEFRLNKKLYSYIGLAAALASYLVFFSFSRAEASRVIPVLQTSLLVPIAAGYLFFGEEDIYVKIVGSILILIGIVMVSI